METTLDRLGKERKGIVKRLEGGYGFQRKISSLGIRIGKRIKIISSQPFRGPLVVEVDSMRIAIGGGMANKIIIE